MKVGSLFSGIGGFDLGLVRVGMEIAWQVEIGEFCRKVLARHAPEYWPNAERFSDVKEVSKECLKPVDLICGGFPCQPFSQAGKQRGKADDRYLWPEMLRIISELKPRWIIGENVIGFINMELENTFTDLEAEGYKVEAFVLPANSMGLPHIRERIYITAYTSSVISPFGIFDRSGNSKEGQNRQTEKWGKDWDFSKMASRLNRRIPDIKTFSEWCREGGISESKLVRVDNGLSSELDRIKSLGNAVVPQIVEILGRCIMEIESETSLPT